jgi:hydroxypyruvate reductase
MNPLADRPALRQDAVSIFQAGIAAADPFLAVKRHLVPDLFDCYTKIHLIAFGKAACSMMRAATEIIPLEKRAGTGIAVTNVDNVTSIDGVDVFGAAHPLPDAEGFKAAQLIANKVRSAKEHELVLVLISGGGSALIPCPAGQITLAEKIATTELLLTSGATINQLNCVRKHLSQLKGGGLARLAAPAHLHALILSDVIGDDLSTIASGPTVADDTTYADAIAILNAKSIWGQVPNMVRHHLEQGRLGNIDETPKPGDDIFINTGYKLIGSNTISLNAALKATDRLGYDTHLYCDRLCGEAKVEAENLAIRAKALSANMPIALLAGGETTVTLKGSGRGGRNQEMALAFALAAEQQGLTGNWVFLSGGTDGRDGPTDATGGLVDPNTLKRMIQSGINPSERLINNDSYTALKSSDDLVMTGATGTNVADLQILLIRPEP